MAQSDATRLADFAAVTGGVTINTSGINAAGIVTAKMD